ncbi:methyltransferase [Hamadaea tsunoensis]|uniref:methyltransferase n=1 Tax=Hamadaea tsunoensis TaxID=53368 RepID=UPI0003FE75A1|nr:methyltransferase [Hamadaea tsunoensis]
MPAPYRYFVLAEFILAALTMAGLRFIVAPYGRHNRPGWGPSIPARLGWLVMEAPASLLVAYFFATGANRASLVPLLLLALWQIHYVHRAFVYPFRLRGGTRMPLAVAAMAFAFNLLNAYVNGMWIGHYGSYPTSWLADPRFLIGVLLFAGGLALNLRSDRILRALRRPGESGYKIPQGGPYRWVSSPNYLGEIVEWLGWALATWSFAGLAFAVYTIANLAPRALANHRWYQSEFPDYPDRKALLPYLW